MSGKCIDLFLCTGNVCRWPAAEGVVRKVVADTGRDHEFEIDSATRNIEEQVQWLDKAQ